MTETDQNESPTAAPLPDAPVKDEKILNRVIKRFGGRHLIYRTELGGWRFFRKPYALVSTFRGPIWFFYGIGQIWVTHKKYHSFDGWMARVPRIHAPRIVALLDKLEDQLTQFTHFCNEHGIEGTVIIEATVIEFHWTFDYTVEKEAMKQSKTELLDVPFRKLVDQFMIAKTELGL